MLAAWEAYVRAMNVPPYILPSPSLVLETLFTDRATLVPALLVTLKTTFGALLAAVIGGVGLAILFTQWKWVERSFLPFAIVLQVTPIIAIAPLLLIYFEAPAAVLGSLAVAGLLPAVLAALVAAALALAWLVAGRRRWPRLSSDQRGQPDLLRLYDRLQRRLGRRRGPPETPLEYLSERGPDALLAEVTERVNRGAYGGDWPPAEVVSGLAAKLDRR